MFYHYVSDIGFMIRIHLFLTIVHPYSHWSFYILKASTKVKKDLFIVKFNEKIPIDLQFLLITMVFNAENNLE